MKYFFRSNLSVIIVFLLTSACAREEHLRMGEELSFHVLAAGEDFSMETKAVTIDSNVIVFQSDTLVMSVRESFLGQTPVTKGTLYKQATGIGDTPLGIIAYHYAQSSTGLPSSAKPYSGSSAVRADRFSSGETHKWLPSSPLYWPGNGYLRFYVYAPYSSFVSTSAPDGSAPRLQYTTPANTADHIDLLVGTTQQYSGSPTTSPRVSVTLNHRLAGVRFRVGPGLTITKVSIQGIYDSGTYNFASSNWSNLTASGNAIEMLNPDLQADPNVSSYPDYSMVADDQIFMLIPQNTPSGATLTAMVNDGTADRIIEVNLSNYSWQAGKLYTYTLAKRNSTYTISCFDNKGNSLTALTLSEEKTFQDATVEMNILSYQTLYAGAVAEPWKIEYSEDDGETWQATPPAWLRVVDAGDAASSGGSGGDFGEYRKLKIDLNPWTDLPIVTEGEMAGAASDMIATLRNRSLGNTAETARDLSLYNIYGEPYGAQTSVPSITAAGHHSANSYVISSPGWYCFPIVFGNSLDATRGDDNGVNQSSFSRKGSFYSHPLGYHACNPDYLQGSAMVITNPRIVLPGATPDLYELDYVWQEVVYGFEFLSDLEIVRPEDVGSSLDYLYARFQIKQGNWEKITTSKGTGYTQGGILPANVLLGLRDGNTKRLMWSWHIWVTDVPGGPSDGFSLASLSDGKTLLNCNLGWTPPLSYFGGKTTARSAKIRFSQIEGGAVPHVATITQNAVEEPDYVGGVYGATFYQWGEKNVLPSMKGDNLGKCVTYGDRIDAKPKPYNTVTSYKIKTTRSGTDPRSSCNTPYFKTAYQWQYNDWGGSYNWNSAFSRNDIAVTEEDANFSKTVVKSVYDPCPAGFCVLNGIRSNTSLEGVNNIQPMGEMAYTGIDAARYVMNDVARWITVVPAAIETDFERYTRVWVIEASENGNGQALAHAVQYDGMSALCVRPMLEGN